jgi:hypothetical protein
MAETNCTRCKGQGWYWRTPDHFNPFLAGGFSTARAMFKVTCSCASAEPATIKPKDVDHG